MTITKVWSASRLSLGALLPIVPAAAATATVVLCLANWPDAGNRGLQLAIGLGLGLVVWMIAALLFGPEVTDVESASSETYEELRARVVALKARLVDVQATDEATRTPGKEAIHEADELLGTLNEELGIHRGGRSRSGYRWLVGHGYINAWSTLHQAEDKLLAVEPVSVVYATAVTNLDRLAGTRSSAEAAELTTQLKALLGIDGRANRSGDREVEHRELLTRLNHDWARALVRESAFLIHRAKNEAWDKIVKKRNQLFMALVLAISLTYAILALAVLADVTEKTLTAAVTFFLVGAVVGVFNALHLASTTRNIGVFDYGLAQMRLLVTPVASGIAALAGVVLTNYAGSFLIAGSVATNGGAATPAFDEIFNLGSNPTGLVVAAIFGLTPRLLLTRLRDQSDSYEQQIEELSLTSKQPAEASQPIPASL